MSGVANEYLQNATPTIGTAAIDKLARLIAALGIDVQPHAYDTLSALLGSSAHLALSHMPPWQSALTDDGSPFEFSVACEGNRVELRALIEPQQAPYNLQSNWKAGLELHRQLTSDLAVGSSRFDRIAELFRPSPTSSGTFAIWFARSLTDTQHAASLKLYLNPQIHGERAAPELVREALERLQLSAAWEFLRPRLSADHPPRYVSLDLSESAEARVKVYVAHSGEAEALEQLLVGAQHYRYGDTTRYLRQIVDAEQAFDARPLLASFAFTAGDERPIVTLHIPARCYAPNDAEVLARTLPLLAEPVASTLKSGLAAWAQRPLETARGLISYVSCRPGAIADRVSLYLSPELFTISSPRVSGRPPAHSMIQELRPRTLTMRSVQRSIDAHTSALRHHPFLRRLDAPGSLEAFRELASHLTFFVLGFQDMLRIASERMSDPFFAVLARAHQREDQGHDRWFLADLGSLALTTSVGELFADEHQAVRSVTYTLVGLLNTTRADAARFAILLVLEAAASEFFGRAVQYLARLGANEHLIFFGPHHLGVEQSHQISGAEEQEQLWAMPVQVGNLDETLRTVDLAFGEMTRLASALNDAMSVHDLTTAPESARVSKLFSLPRDD